MFCRAGRPAGMADEKGNVVSMLHHKTDRRTRGKGELKKRAKVAEVIEMKGVISCFVAIKEDELQLRKNF